MTGVLLVNAFEVPIDQDEEFLRGWSAARDFMERQPGYRGTRLHRSLDGSARFRFINVAEWDTPVDLQAALAHPDFAAVREGVPFVHYPACYEVIDP